MREVEIREPVRSELGGRAGERLSSASNLKAFSQAFRITCRCKWALRPAPTKRRPRIPPEMISIPRKILCRLVLRPGRERYFPKLPPCCSAVAQGRYGS